MGKRTSVYLSDHLAALVKDSGLPMGELIRRGLDRSSELEDTLRRVLREELDQSRPAAIAASTPEPEQDSTHELMPEREPSPEPARTPPRPDRSCKHKRMTSRKGGRCPDCSTWVSALS